MPNQEQEILSRECNACSNPSQIIEKLSADVIKPTLNTVIKPQAGAPMGYPGFCKKQQTAVTYGKLSLGAKRKGLCTRILDSIENKLYSISDRAISIGLMVSSVSLGVLTTGFMVAAAVALGGSVAAAVAATGGTVIMLAAILIPAWMVYSIG